MERNVLVIEVDTDYTTIVGNMEIKCYKMKVKISKIYKE